MSMEELKRKAYQRSFTNVSRKNSQSRKYYRWLLGGFLLVPVAIVLGGSVFFFLPFPLQPDASTLYSTDWSNDFNTWQGAGWHTRLNGGVHSDHGGIFLSPYVADGTAIQLDVQMKNLGEDGFVNTTISFGIVVEGSGNTKRVSKLRNLPIEKEKGDDQARERISYDDRSAYEKALPFGCDR